MAPACWPVFDTSLCPCCGPSSSSRRATRIIWTFNYADLIFVMTSGGPANATQITSTYTLLQAYANLDFGYAAALSVVLLLVMLAFTAAYLRLTRGVEEVG